MKTIARTALLSLALATAGVVSEASAQQNSLAQWLSHMPVNGGVQRIDQNGDGRVNVIFYDVSRNGRVDAARLDANSDGYFETAVFFTQSGALASMYVDTNRSGFFDTLLTDYHRDGRYFVGYDPHRTGQFSGWVTLASLESNRSSGNPLGSSMTIGGGQNRSSTGNAMVDRIMHEHNNAMNRTWLGPYVVIR